MISCTIFTCLCLTNFRTRDGFMKLCMNIMPVDVIPPSCVNQCGNLQQTSEIGVMLFPHNIVA